MLTPRSHTKIFKFGWLVRFSTTLTRSLSISQELLSWYTNPSSHDGVRQIEQDTLKYFRAHYDGEKEVTYQNFSRDEPLECYYEEPEKLEKLKQLKKKWDPQGVFTKMLL